MGDRITKIGNSLLQHGTYNNRIYLMKLAQDDYPTIINELEQFALQEGYTKICGKIPAFATDGFREHGYIVEATIPKFYQGVEDVYFMSKFLSAARRKNNKAEEIKQVLAVASDKSSTQPVPMLNPKFHYRICELADIPKLVRVYKKVFATYPFPIDDPDYIAKTMADNVQYFAIWEHDFPVALSSSEMDLKSRNVEMTDFATLPEYRGMGFSHYLLHKMEAEMRTKGFLVAYSIARSLSFGMNITFAKMGYTYSGTLVNNTNISGNFESMNIWYKFL